MLRRTQNLIQKPDSCLRPTRRIGLSSILLTYLLLICSGHCSHKLHADDRLPFDASTLDSRIARLVRDLDDGSYAARENASEQLSIIGGAALRPLAIKAISGSPESVWRVKQTLELIATQGDEDTFFKSVNILQLLYLDGSGSLEGKVTQLRHKWQLEQKKNIISRLKELGATVRDPLEDRGAMADINVMARQNLMANMIINEQRPNGLFIQSSGLEIRSAMIPVKSTKRSPRLNSVESTKKVDEILQATLIENRNKVFRESDNPDLENLDPDQMLPEELEVQLQIAAMRRRVFVTNQNRVSGLTVSFDKKWTGTSDDLQPLQQLKELSGIQLVRWRPEKDQLAELSKLQNVNVIQIVGEEVAVADLKQLVQGPAVRHVEFSCRTIDADIVSTIADTESLEILLFNDCSIQAESFASLADNVTLRQIYFSDMQIDSAIFAALERLPNLSFVNLSICKFDTAAYRRFEAARPNLQIVFTPQAFLGVRGPANSFEPNAGCEISQVVPDSGAEKGGMQVGDVIAEIDGKKISQFEDLRLHIAQHKAGEVLNVSVRRGGQSVELKIELTKYDRNLE